MPIYLATMRDKGERLHLWEETNPSIYPVPFIVRRKDAIGRYWLVGVRECDRDAARFIAKHMILKKTESLYI